MGANFEIEVVSQTYTPLHTFDEIWKAIGPDVSFDEHLISPNLFFECDKMTPFTEEEMTDERAERLLWEGQVLYCTGLAGGTVHIGVMQYMEDNCFWRSALWFDTQRMEAFDTDKITPEVERLRRAVDRCLEGRSVLCYAMGVEMEAWHAQTIQETRNRPPALIWRFYDKR